MSIGVLYQVPLRPRGLAVHRSQAVMKQANEVKQALCALGYRCVLLKMVPSSFTKMRKLKLQAVINLCQDHIRSRGYLEPHVSAMLDLLDVPYTGSNYLTIATSLDKIRSKELLSYHGLPTPKSLVVAGPDAALVRPFPGKLFLKPAYQDGSLGIDDQSVAETDRSYKEKMRSLIRQFREPILVEQYLPGREFIIEVMGNKHPEILPIAERIFLGGVPYVTADGRWNPSSKQYGAGALQCPAGIDAKFQKRLARLAIKAYHVLGCRDYAKVDIRCNARGRPFIIDVNPHQDLGQNSELALIWAQTKKTYPQLVEKLMSLAMERKKK